MAAKDLRIEWRSRVVTNQVLPFAGLTLVLFAFAEWCGARGIRVTSLDELQPAIAVALAHDGPALVDVVTDPLLV